MSEPFNRAAFDAASRTLLWREEIIQREVAGTILHWMHVLYGPDARDTAAQDPRVEALAARIVLALSELYTTGGGHPRQEGLEDG